MHRSSEENQHVRSEAPLLTLPEACLARVKWRDGMQAGQSVLSMCVVSVRGCREWLMEEVCRLLPSEFCCGVAGLSKPAASLHPVSWVRCSLAHATWYQNGISRVNMLRSDNSFDRISETSPLYIHPAADPA
jgi:hypothetical protein